MKKLLIILAILSITTYAHALEPIDFSQPIARMSVGIVGGGAAAATSFCTTCTGTSDADILCESFENTDCSAQWSDYGHNGTSCVITHSASATSGTGCTDAGTKSMKFTHGFAYQDCYSSLTLGAAKDTVKFKFHVNLNSVSWNLDTSIDGVRLINAGGGTTCIGFYPAKSGANTIFHMVYWNGSGYTDVNGGTNITAGTWYPVQIEYVKDTSLFVKVDYNNDGTYETTEINNATPGSLQCDTIVWGTSRGGSQADAATIEFDQIKVDDDTTPTSCAR
jgi:hypothetical protein